MLEYCCCSASVAAAVAVDAAVDSTKGGCPAAVFDQGAGVASAAAPPVLGCGCCLDKRQVGVLG